MRVAIADKETVEATQWYEARLDYNAQPSAIYWGWPEEVRDAVWSEHHFWGEPWWSERWVVRVELGGSEWPEALKWLRDHAVEVEQWERERDDRELYGDYFGAAMDFFDAASRLAYFSGDRKELNRKLHHCLDNAMGQPEVTLPRFVWFLLKPIFRWGERRTPK